MSRKDKNSNQDIVSNKILLLITISFISALVLMWIYRGYNTLGSIAYTNQIILVLLMVSALFVLFCCFWSTRVRQKNIDESQKILTSSNCTLGGFFALISFWGIYNFGVSTIRILYILIPLYVGLYFISKIYSKSVSWTAYLCAGFGVIFYIFNKLFDNLSFAPYVTPALVVMLIVALIFLNLFKNLQKGDGVLGKPGQKQIRIFPPKTSYWFLVITPVLAVLCGISYYFLGTASMRYGLFAMAGCLFIVIVYHTFKLINQ